LGASFAETLNITPCRTVYPAMNVIRLLLLGLVPALPAHAQFFRPQAVNGAVLGGIAGAVIGNNSGDLRHSAGKGAAIGAAAGLIVGEAVGNVSATHRQTQVPVPAGYHVAPRHAGGYGHSRVGGYFGAPAAYRHGVRAGHHRHSIHPYRYPPGWYPGLHPRHGWPHPAAYSYFGYDAPYAGHDSYYPPSYRTGAYGSRAGAGLLLGALAGGIIGHNSGVFRHDAWRGAAWGAGAGWLLGAVSDAHRRSAAQAAAPAMAHPAAVPASTAPQQVTIINHYYNAPASAMSQANGLFGRN
jgi:uncharacterized protein YcfJ